VTIEMPNERTSCAMGIAFGQRWMVFARGGAGARRSSGCLGTHRLSLDQRLPDLPARGGTVHGYLALPRESGDVSRRGLAGATVWVDTPTGRVATQTARDGDFTLVGVPPGTWTVRFDVGPDRRADAYIDVLSAISRPGRRLGIESTPEVSWVETTTAEFDPARPPDVLRLESGLRGCDAPGSPWISTKWCRLIDRDAVDSSLRQPDPGRWFRR
jgi:hypothetical protein